jgi:hypothetical protein
MNVWVGMDERILGSIDGDLTGLRLNGGVREDEQRVCEVRQRSVEDAAVQLPGQCDKRRPGLG